MGRYYRRFLAFGQIMPEQIHRFDVTVQAGSGASHLMAG
jgi:hypothetical protein